MPRVQLRSNDSTAPVIVSYSPGRSVVELRIGLKKRGSTRYTLLTRNEALQLARLLIRGVEVIKPSS